MNRNNHKSNLPGRKSIRLKGYDYSQPGAYFVTLCTHNMERIFGRIIAGKMELNTYGLIAREEWFQTAVAHPYLELHEDESAIMPNHIHGIIWITEVGATETVARKTNSGPKPGSLGAIVGQYKSRTTRHINKLRKNSGKSVWQRNYYDRIIRNEKELQSIRKYIENNPLHWENDRGRPIDCSFTN